MAPPGCFTLCDLALRLLAVSLLICGTSCENERSAADDSSGRNTPIDLVRQTATFLSSGPDEHFLRNLRNLQSDVLRADYVKVAQDILDSGVLERSPFVTSHQEPYEDTFHISESLLGNSTRAENTTAPLNTATNTVRFETSDNASAAASSKGTTPRAEPAVAVNQLCVNHTALALEALVSGKPWALQSE